MSIDIETPNSPGWWLKKCAIKLQGRQKRLQRLADYHDGNPPLPSGAESARPAYQAFQKKARTNFAELIVGLTRERCTVRSIRTAVNADFSGDEKAWEIWRDNNLDIEFSDVLENMLALGDGYMIVGLDPADDERVIITGEDPRQVVTIHDPARQSEVRAALKMFHDPDLEKDYAFLYLRGKDGANARRYVASRSRKARVKSLSFSASAFTWDEEFGGEEGEELNHPYVPVVRFRNRRGIGEFEPHTDILDRINHTVLQRMVIAAYQAFRWHAIKVDPENMPDEDENGKPIDYGDILSADPGAFLKVPKDVEFWESGITDMQGILASIKDDVQALAFVTRSPLSAVSDSVNQSAEGASLVKEGQIFKTEDKQKRAAAALAIVFMIAFRCLADEARADKQKIVVDWAPAERFSLSEKYDAASKAPPAIPSETVMAEVLQFSPETIALAKSQQMDDAIRGVISGSNTTIPPRPEPAGVPDPRLTDPGAG